MRVDNILQTIGNTPHVRINKLFGSRVEVWMKLERANPGASIKDRIGLAMIEDAEQRGILNKDSVIIETSKPLPSPCIWSRPLSRRCVPCPAA